ncbi:hypothetical protein C8N36_12725 [Pelagimonas varians]|uniref:Uncharacterized protein n=1 Tax=Pelagimonas varians TaxID=696760 RepID=A0A238L5A8_9RHOB|nr:hypothetical protein C8N36_12725 [Pelagimonas varians]SMX50158.1 hypothetical protein PEV8663_04515 [Pelagimonas varians]
MQNVEQLSKEAEANVITTYKITVQSVDHRTTRRYINKLSQERGLENKTIRDSVLKMDWCWLVHQKYAPEDLPNPFSGIDLPK